MLMLVCHRFRHRPLCAFAFNGLSLRPFCSRISSPRCALPADEKWMRVALDEARSAGRRGEVPVGAVLVCPEGRVLGRAGNAVELFTDPSMHAEMRVIREAAARGKRWRLLGTTLYSTLEPCPMCLSTAALARIARIVYAAEDLRIGACGTWVDLVNAKHPFHNFDEVIGGVLREESAELIRDFFKTRRAEKSVRKRITNEESRKTE